MIKQIILVRKDLNMNVGKTAAQVAHAGMMFILHHLKHNVPFTDAQIRWMFEDVLEDPQWEYGGIRKIVLGVEDLKELLALTDFAIGCGLESYLVFDEGLDCTTCGVIGPDYDTKINPVTDHLSLLGR